MEQTEYILTPVKITAKSFEELAEKIVEVRRNQPTAPVTYLNDKTAIVELFKGYEITQNGEGKKNG